MALMSKQILQQLEFARGQIEQSLTARGAARHEVQLQVGSLQTKDIGRPATAKQGANPREQLRQREWLDQVIVGTQVEAEHAIVHAVTGGQNQDWRLDVPLPQRLQDFESAPTWQHQVQDDEVEHLRIRAKEPVFTSRRHDDVVVLRLQRRREDLREFSLVFDDQDTHYPNVTGLASTRS